MSRSCCSVTMLVKRPRRVSSRAVTEPDDGGVARESVPAQYSVTFGAGAALSGAGALIAPLSGVLPTMGIAYVAKAFITVISGGAAIISGTLSASTLLGSLNTLATFIATPVIGEVALLFAAIVLLRILPQGITGKYFRRAL